MTNINYDSAVTYLAHVTLDGVPFEDAGGLLSDAAMRGRAILKSFAETPEETMALYMNTHFTCQLGGEYFNLLDRLQSAQESYAMLYAYFLIK